MDLAGVAVVDLVGPVEHRACGDQVVARDVRRHRTHTAERPLGHCLIRHIDDSTGDALVVVVDTLDHEIVVARPLAADRWAFAQSGAAARSDAGALQREVQHPQSQVGAGAVERLTGIEGASDRRRGGVDLRRGHGAERNGRPALVEDDAHEVSVRRLREDSVG